MKPNIKKLWLKALSSGKYKQGTGKLHNVKTDRHCCLGVLCELAANEGIIKKKITNGVCNFGMDNELLPIKVMKWAGITDNAASYNNTTLTSVNDNRCDGKFARVIKAIQKNF